MPVSGVARRLTVGAVTALVVALAGLGGAAPATSAPPFDETGLMTAGGYAEFDVLANDGDAAEDWYAEPVDTSDPTVSGGFGPSLFVYLYDTPGFTGQRNIPYNVYDGFGDLKRTSTLTLHVTSDVLIAEGGNAQVTLKWPDLPAAVTGARISYSADGLFDHESPGVTTVTRTGPAPWT